MLGLWANLIKLALSANLITARQALQESETPQFIREPVFYGVHARMELSFPLPSTARLNFPVTRFRLTDAYFRGPDYSI